MFKVLSSIERGAKAVEAPSHLKLMELFPENKATVKCAIERDLAFSGLIDRSTSMAGPLQESRSLSGSAQDKQCPAQMTIFYNGAVNVYTVSAEKAEAIVKLAMSACSETMAPTLSVEQISKQHDSEDEQIQKLCGGLPIARKLSLQRFLQKRKDRLRGTAPYSSTWTAINDLGNCKEEDVGMSLSLDVRIS